MASGTRRTTALAAPTAPPNGLFRLGSQEKDMHRDLVYLSDHTTRRRTRHRTQDKRHSADDVDGPRSRPGQFRRGPGPCREHRCNLSGGDRTEVPWPSDVLCRWMMVMISMEEAKRKGADGDGRRRSRS